MGLDRAGTIYVSEKRNPGRVTRLEVGDAAAPSFLPHFKSMHWDGEVDFSIVLQDALIDQGITVVDGGGRITWTRGSRIARFYEVAGPEDGFMEFEVELLAKPTTNILRFTINRRGLNAYPQPALTAQEIAAGVIRPDDVVDSIAFFHATRKGNIAGGKEYRQGKAGHLYRIKATDLLGNWTWCTQVVSGSLYAITIPQAFIDSATYPVIVDPTFGHSTSTPGSGAFEANAWTCKFTPSEAGTITSITTYGGSFGTTLLGNAVYADSSGSPAALLAQDSGNASVTSLNWYTTNLSLAFTAIPYHLAFWFGQDANARNAYDAGAANQASTVGAGTFENWVDPFNETGQFAREWGIYANYTAAASGWGPLLGMKNNRLVQS